MAMKVSQVSAAARPDRVKLAHGEEGPVVQVRPGRPSSTMVMCVILALALVGMGAGILAFPEYLRRIFEEAHRLRPGLLPLPWLGGATIVTGLFILTFAATMRTTEEIRFLKDRVEMQPRLGPLAFVVQTMDLEQVTGVEVSSEGPRGVFVRSRDRSLRVGGATGDDEREWLRQFIEGWIARQEMSP